MSEKSQSNTGWRDYTFGSWETIDKYNALGEYRMELINTLATSDARPEDKNRMVTNAQAPAPTSKQITREKNTSYHKEGGGVR